MLLQILKYLYTDEKYHKIVQCKCQCGQIFPTRLARVKSGSVQSCGCRRILHGDCKRDQETTEYNTWLNMKQRCYNPNKDHYSYYGGRGIKVCKRWKNSFTNFLFDMGRKPGKEYSIDRINVNKSYSPLNCRWATQLQQVHNRRNRNGINN